MILNLQKYLYMAGAALAACAVCAGGGYWKGYADRGNAEVRRAYKQVQEIRSREQALQFQMSELARKSAEEPRRANVADEKYRDAVRTGALRLSVPTRRVPADSAASGAPDQARTELDPTAALRIDSVGTDGDAAVRDLNLCIDLYEQARRELARKK